MTEPVTCDRRGPVTVMARASLLAVALAAIPGVAHGGMAAQEAVEVAGTVVDDATGEPIEGATVRLADASGSARETTTGPDGAFAFAQVTRGTYTLAVRRLGYELLSTPLEVGAQEPSRLDVRLTPQAIPLEPLEVGVEGRPPDLVESGFYDRMEEGWGVFFEPEWIEASKVGFVLLRDYLWVLQNRAPLSRCEKVPVYLDRRPIGTTPGWGTDDSYPGGIFTVGLDRLPPLLDEMSVSDLGAAEVYQPGTKIPMFAWTFTTAVCGAVILWSDWTARLPEIPKIEVKLCESRGRPGEVALDGFVEDEVTEVRLPAAHVSASYANPEDPDGLERVETVVRTDSLGRYRVCDLPEGVVMHLTPEYGPHAGGPMVALAAAGGDALRLPVRVTSPATITGMVLNEATSALIEGARIVLVDTDFRTVTNAAGRFSLEDLPPGSYTIRAVCAGHTGSPQEVELVDGGNIAVVLRLRATDLARRGTCSV
ncbi:MAG: carboxypeptidase regulatory-like domain-containing protein [Gemmatimonadales bacterium]|nr:carboxypeptidase regulatory-like domain-containing protein [Gemmatimonadales bacterium]MYG50091.1 carboxypeptidase regulatory-like domain-containing protein [Gemmatimonadales bacterium]MYK03261.1 carboxypeptidase regulatory-like domain-containing protein [Candidatus Palauibacter ramosifaciens]